MPLACVVAVAWLQGVLRSSDGERRKERRSNMRHGRETRRAEGTVVALGWHDYCGMTCELGHCLRPCSVAVKYNVDQNRRGR